MPFLFITDGSPEAEEYASNYVWYDAADPDSLQRALDEVERRCGRGGRAQQQFEAVSSRVRSLKRLRRAG